jgi:multiple sugar transport system permease protein
MASAAQRRIKSISYAKYGYIFILPFFLIYFFFQLYPLINTFVLSFHGNDTTVEDYVGFDNYKAILFDTEVDMDVVKGRSPKLENMTPEEKKETRLEEQNKVGLKAQHDLFTKSFKNTLILWIGNFIPQILLSLSLAVWFTDAKLKIPGKGFFKVVMYMPNIITAASVAVLFLSLCSESKYGALNQILHSMGIVKDIDSTNSSDFVKFVSGKWEPRFVVMFIQTWMWFGNTMIMLMSGIMGINPSLFEAASIDGASSGQVFRKITLPLLSPIMVYTLVTSMIGGLQMFDIPYLYHKGANDINQDLRTVAVYIYERFHISGTKGYSYGYSGAASVVLFIVTVALGSITFYMNRDTDAIAKKKQRKKLEQQAKVQNKQFGGLGI